MILFREGTEDEAEKVVQSRSVKDFNVMLLFHLEQVVRRSKRF